MLYHRLLRPLLFRLDPERAHDLAISAAASLASSRPLAELVHDTLARPPVRPVTAFGLRFPHPVGLAGGMDKNGVAPLAWWAFGFAFVELGTVTPRPQKGNPRPRMFRKPAELALVNRMGFNNRGAAALARRLADQRRWGLRPNDLPSVCRRLGIGLVHHDAGSDAEACARIVIAAHGGPPADPGRVSG
jgi:dihydroorotate dehydrogenase